jgi:hypothetical protein
MNGQVNNLPQQVELTTATKQAQDADIMKQLEEQRCWLMARIATRTILSKQS